MKDTLHRSLKLKINRETLRVLSNDELELAASGAIGKESGGSYTCPPSYSCPTPCSCKCSSGQQ